MSLACGLFPLVVLSVSDAGSMVMVLWGQWGGGGLREGSESDYFIFSTHTIFLQQNFKLFII